MVESRDVLGRGARRQRCLPGVAGCRRLGRPGGHGVRSTAPGQGHRVDGDARPRLVWTALGREAPRSERVATARDSRGSLWSPRGRAVPGGGGAGGVRGAPGTRTATATEEDPRGGVLVGVSGPGKRKPVRLTTLRRSVVAEAALGAVVLALTAALVNAVPARQAYVPAFTTTLVARSLAGDTVRIDVVVRPTTPGYEGISLRASTPSGRALPLQAAVASFTNPARGSVPSKSTWGREQAGSRTRSSASRRPGCGG